MPSAPSPSPAERPNKTTRTTRQAKGDSSNKPKSPEEYFTELAQADTINDVKKAVRFLHTNNLIDSLAPPSVDVLISGLIWLSYQPAQRKALITEALRAFAYYARSIQHDAISADLLSVANPQLESVIDKTSAQLSKLTSQHEEKLNNLSKQFEDAIDNVQSSLTLGSAEGEKDPSPLGDTLNKILIRIGELEKQLEISNFINNNSMSQPAIQNANSMAGTSGAQSPPPHEMVASMEEVRARQIIVDGLLKDGTSSADLQEDALVQKCNLALKLMTEAGVSVPNHTTFICARKLRNKGVVFELDSPDSAHWIVSQETHMTSFREHLGEEVMLKAHPYTCFVEFVPTSFNPSFGGIDRMEKSNGLMPRSIIDTRWVKNPERRHPGQQYAHMTINFSSAVAANTAVRHGLVINSRKTMVSKKGPEPMRCLKCQGVGHMVASCPSDQDICSHCAGRHAAKDCPHKGDPSKMKCANCLHTDHGAWDRLCPAMVEARKKMIERNPSYRYKYFVTKDPATWEVPGETSPSTSVQNKTPFSRLRDNGWQGFHQQNEDGWNVVDRTGTHGKKPPQSSNRRSTPPSNTAPPPSSAITNGGRVRFSSPPPSTPPRTGESSSTEAGNTTIFYEAEELTSDNGNTSDSDNDDDLNVAFSPKKATKSN